MEIQERLDFQLAWKKVKYDLNYQSFVNNPYLIRIIDKNYEQWIKSIKTKVKEYKPHICPTIDIPKKNWHIRPANVLDIEDYLIYSAIILDEFDNIKKSLDWSFNDEVRFSSILLEKTKNRWFEKGTRSWLNFDKRSLELLENGYNYVLFTDIAGYFENINLGRLMADLEDINFNQENKDLLNNCLGTWTNTTNKGLPQSVSPSHLLGEIYFNTIDQQLSREGFVHARYVDDIRIFCKTQKKAQEGLHLLTRLCRSKALNIETAKTEILDEKKAYNELQGISPIIAQADQRIVKDLKLHNDYTNPKEIRKHPQIGSETTFLQTVFEKYFIYDNDFNSKLFHYLLFRLTKPIAVQYCYNLIFERPEETTYVLSYFTNLLGNYDLSDITENLADKILLEKNTDHLIHEYQKYLFIKWLWENKIVSNKLLRIVRSVARSNYDIQNIVDYAIAYLGDNGNSADYDFIETLHGKTGEITTKSIIVYSLRNMERSRRNSFYGRALTDGDYIDFAVRYAKSVSQ